MSLKKSFMDNEIYGADDINFALSRLTTQGVSLFKYNDGDNPLVSLNNALAEMASPGVDLYNVNGKILFGEMTFFHWSGLMPFEPEEWDYKFGSWIELPEVR